MPHLLYDSVDAAAVTTGMAATAGYIDGRWPSSAAMKAAHPNLPHVSIAVFARDDAMALDCEPGDATIAEAPAWVDRQHARGKALPIVYTSASNIAALRRLMGGRGYLLWSAHYTGTPHICGSCGYPTADATQFWNHGPHGENVDQTLMSDAFFAAIGGPSSSPPPTSPLQEDDMSQAQVDAIIAQEKLNQYILEQQVRPYVIATAASVTALTAAVAALAQHPEITPAQMTTVINDAIAAQVKVTGTLTVAPS